MYSTGEKFMYGILVLLLCLAFLGVGLVIFDVATGKTCYESTRDIGLNVDWSFWEGCRVEAESGRWIPFDNWYYSEHK